MGKSLFSSQNVNTYKDATDLNSNEFEAIAAVLYFDEDYITNDKIITKDKTTFIRVGLLARQPMDLPVFIMVGDTQVQIGSCKRLYWSSINQKCLMARMAIKKTIPSAENKVINILKMFEDKRLEWSFDLAARVKEYKPDKDIKDPKKEVDPHLGKFIIDEFVGIRLETSRIITKNKFVHSITITNTNEPKSDESKGKD